MSWRRPERVTSYAQDIAFFNTASKWISVLLIVLVAAYLPLTLADDWLQLLATGSVMALGAIGLNIVTGYAGQVSLGHAFFVAVGAYTAAVVSGDPAGAVYGLGVTSLPVWLMAAGLVAAAAGALVAPLATRLRGLYLAIVTLGLVFIGEHFFKEWGALSGGLNVGRDAPVPDLFGHNLTSPGAFTEEQKLYWLSLAMLVLFAVLARNLVRSRIGRAFAAVRDRDVAAGVMGVNLNRYKVLAFTISSFYAGVCGALLFVGAGRFAPEQFNLLLSVQFIAMVLIGGVATISGSILGAVLITLLPRIIQESRSVFTFLSTDPNQHPNVFEINIGLYGLLIVAFLLFEPRGLFGIWQRIRIYWKSFPFSY